MNDVLYNSPINLSPISSAVAATPLALIAVRRSVEIVVLKDY